MTSKELKPKMQPYVLIHQIHGKPSDRVLEEVWNRDTATITDIFRQNLPAANARGSDRIFVSYIVTSKDGVTPILNYATYTYNLEEMYRAFRDWYDMGEPPRTVFLGKEVSRLDPNIKVFTSLEEYDRFYKGDAA